MHWALRFLGLDNDADERAVKRAYAARLKTTRPDADPDGFQRLHEAYQAALARVRAPQTHRFDDDGADEAFEQAAVEQTGVEQAAVEQADADEAAVDGHAVVCTAAPVEVAQAPARAAAQHAPAADAAVDAVAATPAFDLEAFLGECIALAVRSRDGELLRFLNAQPALWSLSFKAEVAERLLQRLYAARPPVEAGRFDIIVGFFGLDDLHSGYDAYGLHRLRHRLHLTWEVRTRQLRALAERTGQDGGSAAANLRQTGRILEQLSRPLRLAQALTVGLMPGYPGAIRRFLLRLDFGDLDDLPAPIREDQIAFWTAAGDRTRLSKPRWMVSIARLCAYSFVLTLLYAAAAAFRAPTASGGATGALSLPLPLFTGLCLAVLTGLWLTYLAYDGYTRWQAQPEDPDEPRPWLRRLGVPGMLAIAGATLWLVPADSALGGFAGGVLLMFAALGAWTRHRDRSGPPLGRFLGYWRTFFILLMVRTFDWIDDTGFLWLLAGLTLFIWAKDLWYQRHRLRTT